MLILSRRVGEAIMIGDDVMIKVLAIKSNQVRIGIEAPKDLPVNREEIHERIKRGLPPPHPKEAQRGATDTSTD